MPVFKLLLQYGGTVTSTDVYQHWQSVADVTVPPCCKSRNKRARYSVYLSRVYSMGCACVQLRIACFHFVFSGELKLAEQKFIQEHFFLLTTSMAGCSFPHRFSQRKIIACPDVLLLFKSEKETCPVLMSFKLVRAEYVRWPGGIADGLRGKQSGLY
jgi:hypothetical protein